MIGILAHNIYTGIGFGSRKVYGELLEGRSGLALREDVFGVPDPFFSSLFDREEIESAFASSSLKEKEPLTLLEKAMALSAADAIGSASLDASSPRTLFVISSTKGNVELLEKDPAGTSPDMHIWRSARKVASLFGNANAPVCVTNACASGIVAQICALRAIESGEYDNAVVVGADMLSRFVISGFQCLKALSPHRCRPFDAERCGLNLSEAVATLVFGRGPGIGVCLESGAIRNDATHISAPSRTAEGQLAAIESAMRGIDPRTLAFINVHGTATLYNDNMESVALHRSGLDGVPAVSLKSFFGHTLGAAGVMETVISALALLDEKVLPTFCYETCGVDFPLNMASVQRKSAGTRFLKIMSGFGGINAAALYRRNEK